MALLRLREAIESQGTPRAGGTHKTTKNHKTDLNLIILLALKNESPSVQLVSAELDKRSGIRRACP